MSEKIGEVGLAKKAGFLKDRALKGWEVEGRSHE